MLYLLKIHCKTFQTNSESHSDVSLADGHTSTPSSLSLFTLLRRLWVEQQNALETPSSQRPFSPSAFLPAEVGVHVREAVVLSQGEQDAGRTAAVPLTAEAAVTNAPAGGARPLLQRGGTQQVLLHTQYVL